MQETIIHENFNPDRSQYSSKSRIKQIVSRFLPERQEKRSEKDPEIEAKFAEHYEEIVDFYKKDFSAFSYETWQSWVQVFLLLAVV